MQKVKIGLIGLGGMGQAHINKIKEIPEAELTAVSDVDSQITKKISLLGVFRRKINNG